MIRALTFALILAALPAAAHGLRVFASVSGQIVTVESTFSSGRVPTGGDVRVLDAQNKLLMTLDIGDEGKTEFPLPEGAAETGLIIEVDVNDGHSNYWVLTPDDISHGQGGN
ncbi:hypothetical protein FIU94_10905 [Sulfitobacter sp. THAF37]|uniref:hypothetical protein n=1 Tax=Sulfitobacter sp. THAF37 TaxID=2587855 RepID=UPI001268C642|nr:hypothetical protein [Sulfitobacter sp. THAF37]QFT59332.1 hypothetical protein FIU94_10905 [Sulfitobacter sp. THAF37]